MADGERVAKRVGMPDPRATILPGPGCCRLFVNATEGILAILSSYVDGGREAGEAWRDHAGVQNIPDMGVVRCGWHGERVSKKKSSLLEIER